MLDNIKDFIKNPLSALVTGTVVGIYSGYQIGLS
jgi:hypothetical protein